MPYYLAIDAGGTSTRCLLADETHILARASTGSVKLMRVSEPEATARLASMLDEVSSAANVPLSQIAHTCIGLAGVTIPAVRTWATGTLATHVSGSITLLGDEEIALEAAFPGGSGILLIAGTGSNCIARAHDGTLHRAGGHGPILGDEGGGFWIGLEALRSALRALDAEAVGAPGLDSETWAEAATALGAPSTTALSSWVGFTNSEAITLLNAIQRHFNLTTLPELIELGNRRTAPAPDFAALAPVVSHAASTGNVIAQSVLRHAGAELASLILAVSRKITPTPAEIPIAFTGSILAEIPAVHTALTSLLAQTLPAARLHSTPVDPLLGALHRARHTEAVSS